MWRILLIAVLMALPQGARGQTPNLVSEDQTVQTTVPRLRIFIHNTRPADMKAFRPERTLLFVHDDPFPAEATFDLKLGGVSWMDYIAGRGFDVYYVDLRGYGKSDRPREMRDAAAANPALVRGNDALDDVEVAVTTILARRKIPRLSLMGYGWGASLAAAFTAKSPAQVQRLVLFAPQWMMRTGVAGAPGAYRLVSRDEVRERRFDGVPDARKNDLYPPTWFESFAQTAFSSDPVTAQSGQVIRVPNGAQQDALETWAAGKPYFDPARIKAPTLVAVGEWDQVTPPYMAQTLLPMLANSPARRALILPEGTHDMMIQRSRNALFQAIQSFLEEQVKP